MIKIKIYKFLLSKIIIFSIKSFLFWNLCHCCCCWPCMRDVTRNFEAPSIYWNYDSPVLNETSTEILLCLSQSEAFYKCFKDIENFFRFEVGVITQLPTDRQAEKKRLDLDVCKHITLHYTSVFVILVWFSEKNIQ